MRQLELLLLADAAGLSLIPLRGKRPAAPWKDAQRRAAPAAEVHRRADDLRAENLGVATGAVSRLVVVDCDDHAHLARLLDAEPRLRDALRVRTRRGVHLYVRHPGPAHRVRSGPHLRDLAGVKGDLKADGGYVVGPWSQHPDGGTYAPERWPWTPDMLDALPVLDATWFGGRAAQVIQRVDELERRRAALEQREREAAELVAGVDQAERERRYWTWLQASVPSKPLAEGDGRNNDLYRKAGAARRFALHPEDVAHLLHRYMELAYAVPLPDREFASVLRSAERFRAAAWGEAIAPASPRDAARSVVPSWARVPTHLRKRAAVALRRLKREQESVGNDCEACAVLRFGEGLPNRDALCDEHKHRIAALVSAIRVAECNSAYVRPVADEDGVVLEGEAAENAERHYCACNKPQCAYCSSMRALLLHHELRERFGDDHEFVALTLDTPEVDALASPSLMREGWRMKVKPAVGRSPHRAIRGASRTLVVFPADLLEFAEQVAERLGEHAAVRVYRVGDVAFRDLLVETRASWGRRAAELLRDGRVEELADLEIFDPDVQLRVDTASQAAREHPILCEWPTYTEIREAFSDGEGAKACYEVREAATGELLAITPPMPRWRAVVYAQNQIGMLYSAEAARECGHVRDEPTHRALLAARAHRAARARAERLEDLPLLRRVE